MLAVTEQIERNCSRALNCNITARRLEGGSIIIIYFNFKLHWHRFEIGLINSLKKIMAEHHHQQQQSMRRKLSARVSAAFRTSRQPNLSGRRRAANHSNNNSNNNNSDNGQQRQAAAERTSQRRRLPRGWWPDQGKREGLKLKAMNDLKNETFVSVYYVD